MDELVDPFAAAKANLYSGALEHIVDWKSGRLEKRSFVVWSSHALCVSVSDPRQALSARRSADS